MSATIALPPGTHHLKFIVDGDMRCSQDMPTAVDLNNVLVNYIEISPEQMRPRRESSQKPTKNIIYPAHPPLLPEEQESHGAGDETDEGDDLEEPQDEEIPLGDFRQIIPQYLIDMELPEDNPKVQQANQIINDSPGPPSLPLFLGRSILNGNLPMKDDSSVLTLPNHTVLNHLATSSVRNGVLATSVTTRYKKKVCQ
jgi:5'-AMP-activated protein kinase beta subunit, interaction domain/Glycogen recognition site of AMP-activated protein kinase